jgi:hypothetical protein
MELVSYDDMDTYFGLENNFMWNFGEEIYCKVLTWRASNIEMLVTGIDVARTQCSLCARHRVSSTKNRLKTNL